MSLSRPGRFPLLKLPWLCIKCVLHNSDEFVLIYFATISKRTRRIVQNSNWPLKEVDVHLNGPKWIYMGNEKTWYFKHDNFAYYGELVLQRGSVSLRTCIHFDSWRGYHLESYTAGEELNAIRNGLDFMIDVFRCKIRQVYLDQQTILTPLELGLASVKTLFISDERPINIADLKHVLETIKVTDEYVFFVPISTDFHCDPQIFKSRKLSFCRLSSADWVTLEVLYQFDVPQLNFPHHPFSVEEIVSYITYWFNSDNRKLEFLFACFNERVSRGAFKLDHLNPMPFCEKRRTRCPLKEAEPWDTTDISSGVDILRHDGLLATFFFQPQYIFFYIWHKRFPDAV